MSCKRLVSYIAASVFAVTAVLGLSACRDSDQADDPSKYRNKWFTTVISGSPASLDPQTCSGDTAAQIIGNVFLGLYRRTDGGAVVPAMAESAEMSADGLTWTFRLSENVKWYGSDDFTAECTADDFVFAFRRLVDPSLCSERAKEYYCIKNAKDINTGKIKDLDALGVEAPDKYTLRITLAEPRTDLEALLAAPPAMPCSREFYEQTEGQYGLLGDCIGSNGYFYVSRWHYDKWVKDGNFIELKRNPENASSLDTTPRGVTMMINADEKECFENGTTELLRTSDPDVIFRLSGKYSSSQYDGAVWGMIFNTRGVFADSTLRTSLGGYVRGEFDGSIYTSADRIIPDSANIGELTYRGAAGFPERFSYSDEELHERGTKAMSGLEAGTLSGMKLLIPEGTALRQSIGNVIQQWQKNFGIYCMITELPYSDFVSALESGSFDAAVVKLNGSDAVSYLSAFTGSSPKNYGGTESRKLDDILNSALTADDDTSAAKNCLEAEQLILDNGWFMPLCFEKEYVFFADGVSGVGYDPVSSGFIFGSALK